MRDECGSCPYEMAYGVQFKNLTGEIEEVKQRVRGLETTLSRGVMLLVANLVGVALTLMREVVGF